MWLKILRGVAIWTAVLVVIVVAVGFWADATMSGEIAHEFGKAMGAGSVIAWIIGVLSIISKHEKAAKKARKQQKTAQQNDLFS